ncbi:MAG: right-handed parallel beta-helix repeat-containing protein, partial [Gammaproteobacteria bacterium]
SRVSAGAGLGSRLRASGVLVVVLLVAALAGSLPAAALPMDGGDGGGSSDCLGDTTASFSVSPAMITPGEYVTLRWNVHPAAGCAGMTQSISGSVGTVDRSGSKVVQPMGPSSWVLYGRKGGGSRELARWSVGAEPPLVKGRPTVTITADNQVGFFLQAIATANTIIRIQNHVELDLSGLENLHFEPGVHIIGGRTSNVPGPRLFTTTFPQRLFIIGEYNPDDDVRISGVRLEGAEMGIADGGAKGSIGITVLSSKNVEIDNNEISGWRGAGVYVGDPRRVINPDNYNTVWVHDNFIHHNRHYGREGYGVAVGETAYVLIERNVFDYNRHAIEASGEPGIGYYALRNLVLSGGGENSGWAGTYSHQFDVHGTTESCWKFPIPYPFHKYCGRAGEYFNISYNTILYTNGTGVKLRGRPANGADVVGNVFAHDDEWGGWVDVGAMFQTEGDNLRARDNIFGLNTLHENAWCDFDADGWADRFLATGATWWYQSKGPLYGHHWVYLNTSTKRLGPPVWNGHTWGDPAPGTGDLTFGDVNNDGRCDVTDNDGVVYLGGMTVQQPSLPPAMPVVPNVKGGTVAQASAALTAAGFTKGTVSYVVDPTCNDLGLVISQIPAAGAGAAAGTAVKLSVAIKPSTPCF